MEKHIIKDGTSRYTRIFKVEARKRFNKGESIYIIAHRLSPGMPFSMGMTIDGTHYAKENTERAKYELSQQAFESVVIDFVFYNCTHETGYYPAFYVVSDVHSVKVGI